MDELDNVNGHGETYLSGKEEACGSQCGDGSKSW
jgi:hypothetical protein